jgi:hypothetical protein
VFFYVDNIIVIYNKEHRLEAQAAIKGIKKKYSIIGRDYLH